MQARLKKPGAASSALLNDDPGVARLLDEWMRQSLARPAAAASELLDAIGEQFGQGVLVQIRVEHMEEALGDFRLRGVQRVERQPAAFFDFVDGGGYSVIPCSEIRAIRVLADPPEVGGDPAGTREPRRPLGPGPRQGRADASQ